MKCIATSKNVGGLQASTKKKNGERKQEGGRLQWDDDRVVEIIATDSRMSDGQDEEDQRWGRVSEGQRRCSVTSASRQLAAPGRALLTNPALRSHEFITRVTQEVNFMAHGVRLAKFPPVDGRVQSRAGSFRWAERQTVLCVMFWQVWLCEGYAYCWWISWSAFQHCSATDLFSSSGCEDSASRRLRVLREASVPASESPVFPVYWDSPGTTNRGWLMLLSVDYYFTTFSIIHSQVRQICILYFCMISHKFCKKHFAQFMNKENKYFSTTKRDQ